MRFSLLIASAYVSMGMPAVGYGQVAASCLSTAPKKGVDVRFQAKHDYDPKKLVRKMAEFYRQASNVEVQCSLTMITKAPTGESRKSVEISVVAERPNRIAVRSKDRETPYEVVCDGKKMWMAFGPLDSERGPETEAAVSRYSEGEAPSTIHGVIDCPVLRGISIGQWPLRPIVLELLAADPSAEALQQADYVRYVGMERLDGANVHRVSFSDRAFGWDAWIAADGDPLIRQISVDMSKMFRQVTGSDKVSMVVEQKLSDWKINKKPASNAFVFSPSRGAKKVNEMFTDPMQENSSLIGRKAPSVEVSLLDGSAVRLESHVPNDVVVLACSLDLLNPFSDLLPFLSRIAADFKGKCVTIYAVNRPQSDFKAVSIGLKGRRQGVIIGLDRTGSIGKAFFALKPGVGIGTLLSGETPGALVIIIDKSGVVRAVHDASFPGLKVALRRELDTVLKGEN